MSKPSPTTGAGKGRGGPPEKPGGELRVPLVHSRNRHLAWAVAGLAIGAFLIVDFGIVAQWVGVVLVVMGGLAAWSFASTLLYPPGAIVVADQTVMLPRGVCKGPAVEVARSAIRHAYLLRRAVPWMNTAPVLVVESDQRAYVFPRDWFQDERDQQAVVDRLTSQASHAAA